jgi:hypothetical protein
MCLLNGIARESPTVGNLSKANPGFAKGGWIFATLRELSPPRTMYLRWLCQPGDRLKEAPYGLFVGQGGGRPDAVSGFAKQAHFMVPNTLLLPCGSGAMDRI